MNQITMTISAADAGSFVEQLRTLLKQFEPAPMAVDALRQFVPKYAEFPAAQPIATDPESLERLRGAAEGQAALDVMHGANEPAPPAAPKKPRAKKTPTAAETVEKVLDEAKADASAPVEPADEPLPFDDKPAPAEETLTAEFKTAEDAQNGLRDAFNTLSAKHGFAEVKAKLADVLAHYHVKAISELSIESAKKAIARLNAATFD